MKAFHFLWLIWGMCLVAIFPGLAHADTLSGVSTITTDGDLELLGVTYNGTMYLVAGGDLVQGTTTRWYVVDTIEYLWPDGDPVPPDCPTVGGTSTPKVGDIGAKADNFLFKNNGATDICSIDGIDFQETIFSQLVDTIFVFERGGNDAGTVQAILSDDSLGTALPLNDGGTPYAGTGVNVNDQNAYGYVLETDVPVKGLRITASGHDALVVAAVAETESNIPIPVHHWKLDEDISAGATEAVDSTGGKNGAIPDSGVTTESGIIGTAFRFDGSSTAHVTISGFDTTNLKTMTIAFWIKPDTGHVTDSNRKRVISAQDSWEATIEPSNGFVSNQFYQAGGLPDYLNSSAPLPENEWTHVAMTSDLVSGQVEIYINGEFDVAQNSADDDWAGGEVRIGHRPGKPDSEHFWGVMDDIRIYDQILTEDQIQAIMRTETELRCHWKMNEGSGITVADSVNNGFPSDGIYIGTEKWVTGPNPVNTPATSIDFLTALKFTPTDYVDCGNDPNFNEIEDQLTIAAWVKVDPGQSGTIIHKGSSWGMSVTSTGKVQFEDPCSTAQPFVSTSTIDNGNWHHVAGIYNGNELLLYIDGFLDNSRPTSGSFANGGATDDPVHLGVSLTGAIDDVHLDADVLSAGEILTLAGFTNHAPVVSAGEGQSAFLREATLNFSLDAMVTDDELPSPPALILTWTVENKPPGSTVTFQPSAPGDPAQSNAEDPNCIIDTVGIYTLRLTAFDGDQSSYDEISLTAGEPTCEYIRNHNLLIKGDVTGPNGIPDCRVDLWDYAYLVGYWLQAESIVD